MAQNNSRPKTPGRLRQLSAQAPPCVAGSIVYMHPSTWFRECKEDAQRNYTSAALNIVSCHDMTQVIGWMQYYLDDDSSPRRLYKGEWGLLRADVTSSYLMLLKFDKKSTQYAENLWPLVDVRGQKLCLDDSNARCVWCCIQKFDANKTGHYWI